MKVKKTDDANVKIIEFSIDKETFDGEVNKVYHKQAAKMTVPGFRKGKAPRGVIEKLYGKGVFYEDAVNALLPDAYEQALTQSKLDVVSRPEFDIVSIDDNGVALTAKVTVKPEVTLGEYKGIAVEKVIKPVTDQDIQNEIERVRERNGRIIDVEDRPAEMNDMVVIDFDGTVDGKSFDGGKAEGYHLTLGSGSFIPGFEEQIVGKNIGDSFDVNVTFPADYHAEDLKGKDAVFHVTLHGIQHNELPDLDDEFAKDVSEFDTLDEYKADMRAKMEEANKKAADNAADEKMVQSVVDGMQADIPAVMYDMEVENQIRDYDNRLRQQGLDLQTYLKYTGGDLDALRNQFRPMAERQVKTRLALEKVVKLEKIHAGKKEIAKEYEDIANAYHMDVEQVKQLADEKSVSQDICVRKSVEFLRENAVITEKTEEEAKTEEKAAAKKTEKAKKTASKPAEKKTTKTAKSAEKASDSKEENAAEPTSKTKSEKAKKAE